MNASPQQRRRRGARRESRPDRLERLERERYAAGKWGSAPSAAALPPPPSHWRQCHTLLGACCPLAPANDRAQTLKMLLNVSVSA